MQKSRLRQRKYFHIPLLHYLTSLPHFLYAALASKAGASSIYLLSQQILLQLHFRCNSERGDKTTKSTKRPEGFSSKASSPHALRPHVQMAS